MSIIRRIIDRRRAGEDIGLDLSVQAGRQRTINPDGSFNMERKTGRLLGNFFLYHWLLTCSWKKYWFTVFAFYASMNLLFASAYYLAGVEQLAGMQGTNPGTQFLYCFFFSAQSFTTVGYGGIAPIGKMANLLAALEAFTGLMTFALATGTLYGRFSKPVSRIKYSNRILVAPYNDGLGLQFMVANELNSALMEMEASVNVSWSEDDGSGNLVRRFRQVKLQIDKIVLFPLNWVVNHPVDEESPFYGKGMEEIKQKDYEVVVLLKGFDDVFSQTIYSRNSYTADQFVWGAKFRKPFELNREGKVVMDLTKVGEYDKIELSALQRLN